jgi:NAD(P)-dependent dehydrogenase (short-subunit alcohol dehydrogenase family)
VIAVNLKGSFLVGQAVAREMLKRPGPERAPSST